MYLGKVHKSSLRCGPAVSIYCLFCRLNILEALNTLLWGICAQNYGVACSKVPHEGSRALRVEVWGNFIPHVRKEDLHGWRVIHRRSVLREMQSQTPVHWWSTWNQWPPYGQRYLPNLRHQGDPHPRQSLKTADVFISLEQETAQGKFSF